VQDDLLDGDNLPVTGLYGSVVRYSAAFLCTLSLLTFEISLAILVRTILWEYHYMATGGLASIIS